MTPVLHLTLRSLASRRLTAALTLASIALSVALLVGVERLRGDARASFVATLSGTDLVVGAPSGPVPLLLYAVFHVGEPTSNIRWTSVEALRALSAVRWVVPISLGDSHRGYRVVGTDAGYFEHVRHGRGDTFAFAQGRAFAGSRQAVFEAVLGAEVAAALEYRVGSRIVLAHGAGEVSFIEHADKPFTVVGILERSGTPTDRSVLVSLEAIEAIHADWQGGAPPRGGQVPAPASPELVPGAVTAAFVGLKSRSAVFGVQRFVNEFPGEPLLAILPGATLESLWSLLGIVERALLAVSALVVAVGLAGLAATMVAGLAARRRELAILRALGAGPLEIFALLATEAILVALAGCALGLAALYGALVALGPLAAARWGLVLSLAPPGEREAWLLGAVLAAALAASLIPAVRAYRMSLADGMTVRD